MSDEANSLMLTSAGEAPRQDQLTSVGVVIVTYEAQDFIVECLASLLVSGYPALHVVLVDNASRDETVSTIQRWCEANVGQRQATGSGQESWQHSDRSGVTFTLLRNAGNLGFAGGVNSGLSFLMGAETADVYWILNPDTVVDPNAPAALVAKARRSTNWGIIGARILYHDRPDRVHTDGGLYRRWMGFAKSVNLGHRVDDCQPPTDGELHFISGASMLVSKAFLAKAGLMDESWFLYFEEIDWAFRREELTLSVASHAIVHHRAGASIGSGSGRRVDSAFSVYFMYRNRLRFARRWTPFLLPSVYLWSWAMLVRRYWRYPDQLVGGICGLHQLGPPYAVRNRLGRSDWDMILHISKAGKTEI